MPSFTISVIAAATATSPASTNTTNTATEDGQLRHTCLLR